MTPGAPGDTCISIGTFPVMSSVRGGRHVLQLPLVGLTNDKTTICKYWHTWIARGWKKIGQRGDMRMLSVS